MTNSQLFKAAHAMAKQVHVKGESYQVTFGACLKAIKAEQNKKQSLVSVIITVLFAIVSVMIGEVEQPEAIEMPKEKGGIAYGKKGGELVAFEVVSLSACGNAFVAVELFNRTRAIFSKQSGKVISSCGFTYDMAATKEWEAMREENKARGC